jgi:hypothetical protein
MGHTIEPRECASSWECPAGPETSTRILQLAEARIIFLEEREAERLAYCNLLLQQKRDALQLLEKFAGIVASMFGPQSEGFACDLQNLQGLLASAENMLPGTSFEKIQCKSIEPPLPDEATPQIAIAQPQEVAPSVEAANGTQAADDGEIGFDRRLALPSLEFESCETEEELLTASERALEWCSDAPKAIRLQAEDSFDRHRLRIRKPPMPAPATRPVEATAPEPVPGPASPALPPIVREAREVALKGSRKLTFWLGKLSVDAYRTVEPYLNEIRQIAAQHDGEKA